MKLYFYILSLSNPLVMVLFILICVSVSAYFAKKNNFYSSLSLVIPFITVATLLYYIDYFDQSITNKFCSQLNLEKDQCRTEISMKFEQLNFNVVLMTKHTYVKKFILSKDGAKEDTSRKEDFEGSKYLVLSLINKRDCGSFSEIGSCTAESELESLFKTQKEVILSKSKEFFKKESI